MKKPGKALLGGGEYSIPFQPSLAKAFDICGALIIQQIHYFTVEGANLREGHSWVYNTYEQWAAQIEVYSVDHVRKKIKELEFLGVLRVGCFNKKGYDRTRWYRLDYEMIAYVLSNKLGGEWAISPHPSGENHHMLLVKKTGPIPKTSTQTTNKESKTFAPVEPDAEEGETMKDYSTSGKGKVANSAADILKNLQASKGKFVVEKITPMQLIALWRNVVPKHNPSVKFVGEFTMQQKGMFSQLIKKWGGSENKQTAAMLEFVLTRWTKYVKHVSTEAGIKTTPSAPSINFLLKYAEEARNLFLAESTGTDVPAIKPAPVLKKAVPAPVAPQQDEPEEEEMTLEELAKIGAQFGFDTKA